MSAATANEKESGYPCSAESRDNEVKSQPSFSDVFAIVERLAALLPSGINLDDLMTPEQCAKWLKVEVKTLNKMARAKIVPALLLSKNTLRYHPRTVLAKCHENDFAAVKTATRRGPKRKPFTV